MTFKAKESIGDAHDYYKMATWKTKEDDKLKKALKYITFSKKVNFFYLIWIYKDYWKIAIGQMAYLDEEIILSWS